MLQIVPGKGNSCINVGFAPYPTTEVNSVKDCQGYALGYASLEDKVALCEGKVTRKQHYDVAPLQLDMTAQVKPALYVLLCSQYVCSPPLITSIITKAKINFDK